MLYRQRLVNKLLEHVQLRAVSYRSHSIQVGYEAHFFLPYQRTPAVGYIVVQYFPIFK